MRTKKEIAKKIKELCKCQENFVIDNYGSESSDNGESGVWFSEYATTETLNKFVKWLYGEEKL